MASVAKLGVEKKNIVPRKNKRTHLTPTGLLMEGVIPSLRYFFAIPDSAQGA
jgi:hypothetical protein